MLRQAALFITERFAFREIPGSITSLLRLITSHLENHTRVFFYINSLLLNKKMFIFREDIVRVRNLSVSLTQRL